MGNPLVSFHLKQFARILSPVQKSLLIKRLSFIVVILIFLFGSGYFFFKVFSYLSTISDFGFPLMMRIVESLLMVFFFMILFSNFITAMTTYFRSADLNFYFSLPVKPERIFIKKYLETSIYASWASLVVVIPMIYSYGIVHGGDFLKYVIEFVAIILFAQIAAALGNFLILLLLKIFPRLSYNFSIAAFTLGGLLASLYFWLGKPEIFRVFEIQSPVELARFVKGLGQVGSGYLPSNWLAIFTKDIYFGYLNIKYLGLLSFSGLALYLLLSEFGARYYRQLWLGQRDLVGRGKKLFASLFRSKLNKQYSILIKDIVIFMRDPTQWIQLLIFFILMLIYVFSINRTRFIFSSPFWKALIGFANFAYVSFLFATLGVRFIYPSMSQEGRCFLLLKSNPIRLKTLLYSKFLIYSAITVIIGEALLIITSNILDTDPLIFKISAVAMAMVIITIVSINLSIGSILPDFTEQNPAKLAAGGGGVIAALLCLAYTFSIVILFARPTLDYLRFKDHLLLQPFLINFSLFLAISIIIIIVFLNAGSRSLEHLEL